MEVALFILSFAAAFVIGGALAFFVIDTAIKDRFRR